MERDNPGTPTILNLNNPNYSQYPQFPFLTTLENVST